jgi:hypothetical protein
MNPMKSRKFRNVRWTYEVAPCYRRSGIGQSVDGRGLRIYGNAELVERQRGQFTGPLHADYADRFCGAGT